MKKISRRSFLMATGVIAASAALSACGGSSASTSSAGSTAASTAASGTAAQGGGDLVIYSPNSEGLLNATIPLFEEKYGVNVELIQPAPANWSSVSSPRRTIPTQMSCSAAPGR